MACHAALERLRPARAPLPPATPGRLAAWERARTAHGARPRDALLRPPRTPRPIRDPPHAILNTPPARRVPTARARGRARAPPARAACAPAAVRLSLRRSAGDGPSQRAARNAHRAPSQPATFCHTRPHNPARAPAATSASAAACVPRLGPLCLCDSAWPLSFFRPFPPSAAPGGLCRRSALLTAFGHETLDVCLHFLTTPCRAATPKPRGHRFPSCR